MSNQIRSTTSLRFDDPHLPSDATFRRTASLTHSQVDLTIFGDEAKQLAARLASKEIQNVTTEEKVKKQGAFAGVFVPTCENMWGVLIFLRFYYVVGEGGIGESLLAMFLSFVVAFCTTSCLSAIASSGGIVS